MHKLFDKNGIWQAGDYTLLDVNNLNKAVKYLAKHNPDITEIGVSTENDFKNRFDVDFALIKQYLPKVKNFWMRCLLGKNTDISPLYEFEYLEKLSWDDTKTTLEIGKFPQLKELYFWDGKFIDFTGGKITKLGAVDVDNLLFLKELPLIEKLKLRAYNGKNLDGIEYLKNLQDLTIFTSNKLTDISHITQCQNLQVLHLESVNKNIDLSTLSQTNISYLYLHNVIKNCAFVQEMKNLEHILIKEVLDNDLSPLVNSKTLKFVYLYKHKRAYNYSKKEFEERFPSDD